MPGQDGVQPLATVCRDHRVPAAPVGRAGPPADQAIAVEPVDDPGDAAGGERGLGGQVGHPQLPVGRAGQPHQHFELDRREVVLGQLRGEPRRQALVCLGEQPDRGQALVVHQLAVH